MKASRDDEEGVNIQPIAPPLEFPGSRATGDASRESAEQSKDGHTHDDSGLASQPVPPRPPNSMTEVAPTSPKKTRKRPPRWETSIELTGLDKPKARRTQTGSGAKPGRPGLTGRHTTLTRVRPEPEAGVDGEARGAPSKARGQSYIGPYPGLNLGDEGFKARAKISSRDGRLGLSMHDGQTGRLAKTLGARLERQILGFDEGRGDADAEVPDEKRGTAPTPGDGQYGSALARHPSVVEAEAQRPVPKLNIVIMVLGSRGDIQPFLRIGQVLREYGHRVRIASHPAFKDFVENDTHLEFFSVGGDPAELMAFMVKNPGLIPSMETVKSGEIGRRREQMFHMFKGFWRACINATDGEPDSHNLRMMNKSNPFVADAIIANPASFAHIHCAERLGVPLHLMFTFPQTPTTEFPNPLAKIRKTNINERYSNFMSYPLVDMITWQGLGDLVNLFRVETLGLEPVSTLWAPGQIYRLRVPFTYLWSPDLVPKPHDWGPEIDIAGFVFLSLASAFKPPETLVEFLEAGPEPIYIGFGSIVVDDPDRFTAIIFEAVVKAGVRALVSKGWGGLGAGDVPPNVYLLDNSPHDWIFPRVSAVIHHGGAGTTAIGLKCGRPTMIVPFFGDQPFWAERIAKANAGYYEPVPYKRLTVDKLVDGIRVLLSPEIRKNAQKLAEGIAREGDGARNAVESFHRHLPLSGERSMRCSILDDRVAVWKLKNTSLRLSALAAQLLVAKKKLHMRQLRLLRHYEWNDFSGPGEPVTGAGAAVVRSVTGVAKGVGSVPVKVVKGVRRHRKRRGKPQPGQEQATNGAASKPASSSQSSTGSVPPQAQQQRMGASSGIHEHKEYDDDSSDTSSSDGDDDDAEPREETAAEEIAHDVERSLEKSGKVLLQAPMDITLAIAQGLHNAPRLYGDETVRKPTRITGLHSGLRAAGEEFIYGIYDGVTGLVVQPYRGARKDGLIGFAKGMGRGVGGFVLKDMAAVIGPFGFTLKGIHKELRKHKDPTHFIRQARVTQGRNETTLLSQEDAKAVFEQLDRGWAVFQDIRKFVNRKKAQGIRGRLQLKQEEKRWQQYGAFENVARAKIALEATKEAEHAQEISGGPESGFESTAEAKNGSVASARGPTTPRNGADVTKTDPPISS